MINQVFKVLSEKDIELIKALNQCVIENIPNSHEFISGSNRYTHDASNITYLNGFLQMYLPHIHRSLILGAMSGIQKAEWDKANSISIQDMGIRTVQFISTNGSMDEFQSKLDAIREENRLKSQVFSIGGPDPVTIEEVEEEIDPLDVETDLKASVFLSRYHSDASSTEEDSMSVEGGSEFTLMIILSNRHEFAGGEILVRKKSNRPVSNRIEKASEHIDEEDEEDEEHVIDPNCKGKINCLVSRFTPDKV